jgi:signal transduction histidine kinase
VAGTYVGEALVALGLSLPPVVRATGVPAWVVVTMVSIHVAWTAAVRRWIRPRALRRRAAMAAIFVGNAVVGESICLALPALGGDPKTPLWALAVMYACMNGALRELPPTWALLGMHVAAPLATIPVFLARGAGSAWAVAGPIVTCVVSAVGYHHLAMQGCALREARERAAGALARSRERVAELERERLARDLHDTVGSTLAVVGACGELVDRHAADAGEIRRIVATLKDAARAGLGELRAVIAAVAPEAGDLRAVADELGRAALRAARASGVRVDVEAAEGAALVLDGPTRLTIVRVFQEALQNALKHGRPSRLSVRLAARGEHVHLEVQDDGGGFRARGRDGTGRGLRGMTARAAEVGGTCEIVEAAGGVVVRLVLPVARRGGA